MPYRTYETTGGELPFMRKWVMRGLILSVLFHGALVLVFQTTKLERFATMTHRLVPRELITSRINLSADLIEDKPPAEEAPAPKAQEPRIDIPADLPNAEAKLEDLKASPLAPPRELTEPIVTDKPRVDSSSLQALARQQQSASQSMQRELDSTSDRLLNDRPKSSNQSLISLANRVNEKAQASGRGADAAGLAAASSRLDGLLGQSGLKKGEGPLALPGGALFGFGSAELGAPAIELMRKLGELIRKNPYVIFSIEGHTDSFGDDLSNQQLSLARAEAVRMWLVQNMGVDPGRVQTRGFGRSKLIVPPRPFDPASVEALEAEKARQQPNRRVEIVFLSSE